MLHALRYAEVDVIKNDKLMVLRNNNNNNYY